MQFAQMIENVPKRPGVYQMFDVDGLLLYVGKAKNLHSRLHQYLNIDKLSYHIKLVRRDVARVEIITTATESDALLLESDLIKNRRPRYNILLTDDKMYPMLTLSDDEYPRLHKFRGRAVPKRDVFGPYPSVGALNETIKLIQKVCQIRTCTNSYMNNRARPCLLHQINRCSAPCQSSKCKVQNSIDNKTNTEPCTVSFEHYRDSVTMARRILSGDIAPVVRDMSARMQTASRDMDFESAAKIRDRIRALVGTSARGRMDTRDADFFAGDFSESPAIAIAKMRCGHIVAHQIIRPKQTDDMTASDIMQQTILWFYSENPPSAKIITNVETPLLSAKESFGLSFKPDDPEIKKLMTQIETNRRVFGHREIKWRESVAALGRWLGIDILRADVFDTSHLFGNNPVGAMIVLGPDGFAKSEYRHYKLENATIAGNDVGMMREFLLRRFAPKHRADKVCSIPVCSLLIVDGGMAQWNAARHVLKELNLDIKVLGVTKGQVRSGDEHFVRPDGTIDTSVPKDSPVFLLLRAVRDEAHRFAVQFHRKRRAKAANLSALDEIDGIGTTRKRALMHHFGSVAQIANADTNTLARVHGISKSVAKKIYSHFHCDSV